MEALEVAVVLVPALLGAASLILAFEKDLD